MPKTSATKLSSNELRVIDQLAHAKRRTLLELAAKFSPTVPRPWPYATEVSPADRSAWCSMLVARNSVRKPVRLGLIAKTGRGTYRITPRGRKILAHFK
jgi:hypothetical protein